MLQDEPPWDYPALVRSHFPGVHSLLDQGTGGGELLGSLAPLPPDTHATEAYPPNQPIAQARLAPLGVSVHAIEDDAHLPFEDNAFDLIINRHEFFDAQELYRLLKPGGRFVTQQVGGLDNLELNQILDNEQTFPYHRWGLADALTQLYEAGLTVSRAEKAALRTSFLDIGAVIYYLKVIAWQVEGFDVEQHLEQLVAIHNIIERQGAFLTTAHRFLVLAQKGA
ncbi:methyltransferase domain-containing protein [bacterium]|nr:methyltransferase domain-containing protein [bacterium]